MEVAVKHLGAEMLVSTYNIDLHMTLGYDFKSAVSILMRMYDQHRSRLSQTELPAASN